ncbi:MAG: hypothetical protein HZB38_07550 [Planctomycetes bacterium]|nr:hypothetical protein [Planctomycetota bacterium]
MSGAPRMLPETVPPTDLEPPVRAMRIPILLALPLAPLALLPKRMGSHVAASSLAAAWFVHFGALVFTIGEVAAAHLEGGDFGASSLTPDLTWLDWIRRPLAGAWLVAYEVFDSRGASTVALAVAASIEGALAFLALLFVPFLAAGERPPAVFLRSLKCVLWSSAVVVAFAVFYHVATPRQFSPSSVFRSENVAILCFWAWVIWWISIILRLGARYGGPCIGPRWTPRPLLCESCGYHLANLPEEVNCPECGRPARESLPGFRRLPPMATAPTWLGRVAGFFATLWQSLADARFASRVTVWNGQTAARRFALLVCLLGGVLFTLSLITYPQLWGFRSASNWAPVDLAATLLWCPLAAAVVMFVVLLLLGLIVSRLGFGQCYHTGVILCYCSPLLLLFGVVFLLCLTLATWIIETFRIRGMLVIVSRQIEIDKPLLVYAICLLPALFTLLFVVWRAARLFRAARYANS